MTEELWAPDRPVPPRWSLAVMAVCEPHKVRVIYDASGKKVAHYRRAVSLFPLLAAEACARAEAERIIRDASAGTP